MNITRREWHALTCGALLAATNRVLVGQSESRFSGVLVGMQSYSFRDMENIEQKIIWD